MFFDEKNIDCKKSENQNIHRNMSGFLEESLCTQLIERRVYKAGKSGFMRNGSIIVQIFLKFVGGNMHLSSSDVNGNVTGFT